MNINNKTIETKDRKVILSTLWIFAMLNYLYCDILALMDPDLLNQFITGNVGGIHMTQAFLLQAAILTGRLEIPWQLVVIVLMPPFCVRMVVPGRVVVPESVTSVESTPNKSTQRYS